MSATWMSKEKINFLLGIVSVSGDSPTGTTPKPQKTRKTTFMVTNGIFFRKLIAKMSEKL